MPQQSIGNLLGFPLGGPKPGSAIDAEIKAAAFGKDLFFRDDLEVAASGDYSTIDGVANLRAAIMRRCMTRQGEYRLRPTYGIGLQDYVKKPMTTALQQQLQHRIIENLAQEPRIQTVLEARVEPSWIGGDPVLRVTVRAICIGREVKFPPFEVAGTGG